MTERLYYQDASLLEFEARVLALVEAPDGHRGVVLDRTAFYPTSGGQPFDTGVLGGRRVLDVIDREDGSILHVVEGDLMPGPVHGRIDAARRLDHVQQHSGQHLLSAAFERVVGARTVSFHLGAETSTIDLDREVTAEEAARAESDACRIVWEDHPVTIRFADEDEAAALPLRKPPARGGQLRIVDMDGYDLSACGGTHVARTGSVGMIVVSGLERVRGGSRVAFLCGGRALDGYRLLHDSVAASTRLVSVLPVELPGAVDRLQTEARELKRQVKDLQGRLASHEAAALAAAAEPHGAARIVVAALEGWDAAGLRTIASAVAARAGHAAVLLSSPSPAAIVVARAADVNLDSGAVLRTLVEAFGGKGGGRPDLAQGGGLTGTTADMLARAREILQR
jgi:alanyl-tRNA synthetase